MIGLPTRIFGRPSSSGSLPPLTWPRKGCGHYQALGNPDVHLEAYVDVLWQIGANFTRAWMVDAWAARGPGEQGTYDGFVPVRRADDGRWDLFNWSDAYFGRLREFVVLCNDRGIIPQLCALELYSWAERKAGSQSPKGMLWVPNQDLGPWRNNVQGVRWGWPDDPTFYALPDLWMRAFLTRVVQTLEGTVWVAETGNEMPEKPMHQRIARWLRDAGFRGEITTNRQEDTPGQYVNMQIGKVDGEDGLELLSRIAYHGKGHISYLDEVFDKEPEYPTMRSFFDSPACEPARVIWSSDGVGQNKKGDEMYDEAAMIEVTDDCHRRGFSVEHQAREWKLSVFLDGKFDLSVLRADFARRMLHP